MSITKYSVTGMTCGGCVTRVKATLASMSEHAEVSLNPPEATLTGSRVSIDALNQALADIGHYQLSEIKEVPVSKKTIVDEPAKNWLTTYYPLLLIFGFITLVSLTAQFSPIGAEHSFDSRHWMMNFMAGFFLVFSFFKLLDVRSFADSYAMYDLLAMRVKAYGLIYPFIELGLGFAYLLAWQPTLTNWLTLIVMAFSSLGVIRSVLNKQKIRCACLGAVFNLPMSTVTIVEDLLMAGMALWMLIL